ncbi:MAG: hypothetical protein EON87_14730 [Brevundimonas sp.]|nr:MAG: hypothetical protein EON87_14730 [Brevundimonas sp.]
MKRITLGLTIALAALSLGTAATACSALLPHPALPGETSAQLIARGKRMHQDALRTRADSVFLAQVSAARMIGQLDAEYTLTPFFALYDTSQPDAPVVMNDSPLVTACEVEPDLGRVYVVYAARHETGWRVIEIVRHADLQDPPPGMPTARDMARGFYQLPTYPDPPR